jgi:hypothetical protein
VTISNSLYPILCRANAVIVLEGDNSITADRTGIQTWADYREGDAVPTLEINGTGSLNVTAVGSSYSAAIGSPNYRNSSQAVSCGNITISGGTVTATGGENAAGIGGGSTNGVCGTITITKGVTSVKATKGANTPNSIGAGDGGQDITVNIENGANVTQK